MTFANEISKPNSNRFVLLKMTPGRYISSWTNNGGGVYQVDLGANVERVERNGVALTEVSQSPTSNDTWYWNGSQVLVKLAAAPSASNLLVVFYNLFYTSGEFRIAPEDPTDSSAREVHWEPKLIAEPSVSQDVSNLLAGFLTSSISQISILNSDNHLQQYLTDDDSFSEKTVKAWMCANGTDNIQSIFEGRIRNVTIANNTASFQVYDVLSLLDQPCLMKDPVEDAYFLRQSGGFPNMYPKDHAKPVPYIIGPSSYYITKEADRLWYFAAGDGSYRYIDFTDDASTEAAIITGGTASGATYTTNEFANAIGQAFFTATTDVDAEFNASLNTTTRKWTIEADNTTTFELHWNTGVNKSNHMDGILGFSNASDDTGATSYTSDTEVHWDEADEISEAMEAVCTNYRNYEASGFNLEWGLCRVNSGGVRQIDLDYQSHESHDIDWLIDPRDSSATDVTYWDLGASNNVEIGDTFRVRDSSLSFSYHRVVYLGDFLYDGTTYNMVTNRTASMASGTPNSYTNMDAVTLVIEDRDRNLYYPMQGRDYSLSSTTLDSGNKYYYITFSTSYYSNLNMTNYLNPQKDKVFFRFGAASNTLHSAALKEIADNSGVDTNAASFTTAGTTLSVDAQFSIPQFDERDYKSYRFYIEQICKSAFGVLYLNTDFEMVYSLFSTPGSGNETDTSLYNNLQVTIEYQDIVTELVAFNPHNNSQYAIDATTSPAETVTSLLAEYLHGRKNSIKYRHVLKTITSRVQDIFDVLSNRRAIYTLDLPATQMLRNIDDDFQLTSGEALGTLGYSFVKIIGLKKGTDKVIVKATDLLDI